MTDGLRIGDVARSAGVNVQTLRYERRGLVLPEFRRHSGQREYDDSAVGRVRAIKAAQQLGFTLTEIQELFDLSAHRRGTDEPTRGPWRRSRRSTSGSSNCRECASGSRT